MINKVAPYSNSVNVNFTGVVPKVNVTKNKAEIKELVDIFYNTSYPKGDSKANFVTKFFNDLRYKFSKKLRFSAAQNEDFVVGVQTSPKKGVLGGYSMYLDENRDFACVDFIATSPKIKGTKEKIKALIEMGKNICEEAKKRHFTEIVWRDSDICKTLSKLIKEINPKSVEDGFLYGKENSVFVSDLEKKLKNVVKKYRLEQ